MFILRMASRNLFRQKSRNSLSMISIILGVFVIVVGTGFADGLDENVIRAQIDESGHVELVPGDYPKAGIDHPIDELYSLSAEDAAWLDEEVEVWAPRVVMAPRLIKGRDAVRVRLIGYDSQRDEQIFPRDGWEVEGEWPEAVPDGVLVSTGVAELLDLSPGEVVIVEARTAEGALNAMQLTVSGVVHTGAMFFDRVGMISPREVVDRLALSEGRNSHVSVLLSNRHSSEEFALELEQRLGESVEARTWQEASEPLLEAGEMRRSMFNFLGFALLAMAATGIANTILMAAFERVREIGTMRALGLTRRGVVAMFAIEGAWMGLVGGIIGASLGGVLCWHYNRVGIDIMSLMGAKGDVISDMPVAAMLYFSFNPVFIAMSVVIAVIAAVAASLYPAIIASRLLPAQAVRAE